MTVCDCEQRCRGRAAAVGSVERRTLSPGPGSQSGAVSEAPTAAASSRSRRHSRRHPTAAGRAAPTGLRGSGVRGVPRRLFPRTASRGCLPAQGDGPVRPGYHIGACQWRTRMADRGLRRGRTVLLRAAVPGLGRAMVSAMPAYRACAPALLAQGRACSRHTARPEALQTAQTA